MASGDVYQIALRGRLGSGQDWINRWRYVQTDDLPGNPAEDLARSFDDALTALFQDAVSANYVIDQYEVRQISAPGTEGYILPVNAAGHVSGDVLPPMDCVLVTWTTPLFGRKYHGRTYFPAPTEGEQNGGTLNGDTIDGWGLVTDPMLSIVSLADPAVEWGLVVYHPDTGGFTSVTGKIVRNLIATQRRRRAGVGS